jgi:transcription factor C subunit 6
MASTTPVRRSGRARVTPRKYTTDAFADLKDVMDELSGVSSDSHYESLQGEDSDAEFDQAALADAEQAEADEQDNGHDKDQDNDELDEDKSDEDRADVEGEEAGDSESVIDVTPSKPPRKGNSKHRPLSSLVVKNDIHSIGIAGFHARLSREERVVAHVGTGDEDVIAHVRFRDQWQNAHYMPTRKGIGRSPFYPAEKRFKEATDGFRWYYDLRGRDLFQQGQVIQEKSEEHSRHKIQLKNSFIIGPTVDPNLIHLNAFQSITLQEAFTESGSGESGRARSGWILNVNYSVQCLEWAPNRNEASQYLITSMRTPPSETEHDARDRSEEHDQAPLFPKPRRRSCFHIWEFTESGSTLDNSVPPKLRAVISYDWNDARQLKWCPAPLRDDDGGSTDTTKLGLLAGVWMDGYVRVLDIVLPNTSSTAYLHISKACFESRPPETIVSTVTWLSTCAIAAGCANGQVAVWDIPSALGIHLDIASNVIPEENAKPWLYKPFHETYITNITCGYPSRPYALFTNSIDGQTRLTDLRDPKADVVFTKRVRLNQPVFAWHDASQQLLNSDENCDLVSHFLRVFHSRELLIRWNALITDIATSELHPIVLSACADGTVGGVNVAKRLKDSKTISPTRQVWFKYEWRDAIRKEWNVPMGNVDGDSGDSVDMNVLNNPLGRFTDGYKVEQMSLNNVNRHNVKEGLSFSTIYELSSAITRVSWNPNITYGTWAAAATGSGLIRIEDLAVD